MSSTSFFRRGSIKRKLALIIFGTTTIALLLISAAFIAYDIVRFREGLVRELTTEADLIGANNTAALLYDFQKDASDNLNVLRAQPRIIAAALYSTRNTTNRPFATYTRPGVTTVELLSWPSPVVDTNYFGIDDLTVIRPIESEHEVIGALCLKTDLRQVHERLIRYAGTVAVFVPLAALVAFALSFAFQGIITKPLLHLADTARLVSVGKNYAIRATKRQNDELGLLVDGFNEMLTQIQKRDEALRTAHDELERRVSERTLALQQEIVERKRAELELQQQVTRISLLNRIAQGVSARQDVESILNIILRQIEENLRIDLGVLYLYDRTTESLTVAGYRLRPGGSGHSVEMNEGSTTSLTEAGMTGCRQGLMLHAPDPSAGLVTWARQLTEAGYLTAVCLPLMVDGKLFGILKLARRSAETFNPGDCEFLRMLSEHAALAAYQARLHAQLRTAYDELRQTQQAVMQQERLRALGQMASGIAHDINNAISPAVGYTDLLLLSQKGIDADQRRTLDLIKTSVGDVVHLVSRLREFYRRREGREPVYPVNLNRLVEQVVDLTRPRWRDIPQGNGLMVEMRTELDPVIPELLGVESELREALTNLVLNAVDAMPDGGVITVRTSLTIQRAAERGEYFPRHVVLEVSDTGTGMDEETRKRCLEPFFSTKGQRGTGLGLAMVYGIIERYEGKIEIDSALNQGTTMRLIFPCREAEAPKASPGQPVKIPRDLRVLCVDDEPLVRQLLKEILEFDRHQVHLADGGQVGVDAFRTAIKQSRPFDIVLTDLGMPHVDGRQLARIVKLESPHTPVIMLTGWGSFMQMEREIPPNVDGILSKPPRITEIREAFARVIGSR